EPTEGLVVIDVNSGRFKKKINQEEMAFRVNSEAAHEVAHQLRLRDLGGIIVIDFIDMQYQKHRQEVLRILKEGFDQDRANTEVLGISKLGLVEMTRERVHRTIESMSYHECPHCHGKGKVKSVSTIAIGILRDLKEMLQVSGKERKQNLEILCHPDVASYILNFNKNNILTLERRFRTKIQIKPQDNFHIEETKIA
ncbi:MAG: ribonuclease E/G, partial [Candidatus Omnitrophota bacterium]